MPLPPHVMNVTTRSASVRWPGLVHELETAPQYAGRIIPLGELQNTARIARATAFLWSDAADSMTGSVLLIGGGCSLFQFAEDDGE
jgi:NAD(P)-dependent dehydrogenase (short-subunit alcohol dehydrogenase family)